MTNRIGLMSYADDPDRVVFRVVMLRENEPDSELDNPRWWVEGIDPDRPVQMNKIGIEVPQGQSLVETSFVLAEGAEQFVPEVVLVADTVVVQPGEMTWEPPNELIEAMAELRAK